MIKIDHFMYAVASLDEGVAWAADTFGAQPAQGGAHLGLGTRNALLSLGDTYLEIIAPDPGQNLDNTLGARLAQLKQGGLVTWAASGDLAAVANVLQQQAVEYHGPQVTQRETTSGDLLVWQLLFPRRHAFGSRLPFFIDWMQCPHPSVTNPNGGEFTALQISMPKPAGLEDLFQALSLDVLVVAGEPGLQVRIESPRGSVTLASNDETNLLSIG